MPPVTSMATRVNVTVFSYINKKITGVVKNDYCNEQIPFQDSYEMIAALDDLLDRLHFPQASMARRQFDSRQKPIKWKTGDHVDQKIENKGKADFIVHVQFRQNATWQGTIQWVNQKKTQKFRSALEMLKLMDEALSQEEETSEVSFLDNE